MQAVITSSSVESIVYVVYNGNREEYDSHQLLGSVWKIIRSEISIYYLTMDVCIEPLLSSHIAWQSNISLLHGVSTQLHDFSELQALSQVTCRAIVLGAMTSQGVWIEALSPNPLIGNDNFERIVSISVPIASCFLQHPAWVDSLYRMQQSEAIFDFCLERLIALTSSVANSQELFLFIDYCCSLHHVSPARARLFLRGIQNQIVQKIDNL